MHQKLILRLGITGIALATSILLLSNGRSKTPEPVKKAEPTCCKKTRTSCQDAEKQNPDDLIIENISHQFISVARF